MAPEPIQPIYFGLSADIKKKTFFILTIGMDKEECIQKCKDTANDLEFNVFDITESPPLFHTGLSCWLAEVGIPQFDIAESGKAITAALCDFWEETQLEIDAEMKGGKPCDS